MPYVNHRWLGGLLTNFQTISLRIKRLHDLERYETEGQLRCCPRGSGWRPRRTSAKLRANLGGVKNMQRVPDAVFVIDLKTEAIAVREAQRLRIPIIGLVDTNCDPEGIDYVIPGNDDAIRSCAAITTAIGDVVAAGPCRVPGRGGAARLERERQEAEERARREAEEQARREAEERALPRRQRGRRAAEAEAAAAAAAGTRPEPRLPPPDAGSGSPSASSGGDRAEATAPAATAPVRRRRRRPTPVEAPEAARRRADSRAGSTLHRSATGPDRSARRSRAGERRRRQDDASDRGELHGCVQRQRTSRPCATGRAPGMMACREALVEADGDIEQAVEILAREARPGRQARRGGDARGRGPELHPRRQQDRRDGRGRLPDRLRRP